MPGGSPRACRALRSRSVSWLPCRRSGRGNAPSASGAWGDSPHCTVSRQRGVTSCYDYSSRPTTRETMDNVAGKVAFITGGGSGIGLGMAQVFLENGVKVAIADIRQDHLDTAMAHLRSFGAQVHPV